MEYQFEGEVKTNNSVLPGEPVNMIAPLAANYIKRKKAGSFVEVRLRTVKKFA